MAYRFDGANDNIFCSIGACNFTGDATLAAICRVTDTTAAWSFVMGAFNSTNNLSGWGGFWRVADIAPWETEGDTFYATSDSSGAYHLSGELSTVNWSLIVAKKTTGNVAARMSRYDLTTADWTHSAPFNGITVPDGALPGSGGSVRFGEYAGSDDAAMDLLVGGTADSILWASDAALEADTASLVAGIGGWDAKAFAGLWGFIDSSSIVDRKGSANETSRSGTTVVADPAGWDWGLASAAVGNHNWKKFPKSRLRRVPV